MNDEQLEAINRIKNNMPVVYGCSIKTGNMRDAIALTEDVEFEFMFPVEVGVNKEVVAFINCSVSWGRSE